jgi:hypothetical protein
MRNHSYEKSSSYVMQPRRHAVRCGDLQASKNPNAGRWPLPGRPHLGFPLFGIAVAFSIALLFSFQPSLAGTLPADSEHLAVSAVGAEQIGAVKLPAADRSSKAQKAARDIADKAVTALGGAEKIRGLYETMTRAKAKSTDYSTISAAVNTVDVEMLSRLDKFRLDVRVFGQNAVTGYDGKSSWTQQGDQVFPSDPITSQKISQDTSFGGSLLLRLCDGSTPVGLVPERTVNGRSCYGLWLTSKNNQPAILYIDRESSMILREEYQGLDFEQGRPALKSIEFADYRPFLGSVVAYKTVEYIDDKKNSEMQISEIEVKLGLSDSIFEMPQAKPDARLSAGPVVMPFEYISNEVVLKGKVNDATELRFILDTGATQNVMTRSSATAFGAVSKTEMSLTTGSGFMTMGSIVIDKISLGDLKITNVPFAVSDLPALSTIKGAHPSGIIGANILRRFILTIDYPQRTVTFSDPSTFKPAHGATVIQAQPTLGSAGLAVQGVLDGKSKLPFLVDTGAAFNSVAERLVQASLTVPLVRCGTVQGVDGNQVKVGAVQFRTLQIADIIANRPVFSVTPYNKEEKTASGLLSGSSLGILGNPFWSRFRMSCDYLNGKLILERSSTEKLAENLRSELAKAEINYRRSGNALAVDARLHDLLAKTAQDSLRKERVDILLLKARIDADQAVAKNTSLAGLQEAAKGFDLALDFAKKGTEANLQAKVYADRALFLLDHSDISDNVSPAQQLLISASTLSDVEPDVLVCASALFTKVRSFELAKKTLEQALIQEPANWRALIQRYIIARRELQCRDEQEVLALLHHYFPGCVLPAYATR